MISSLYHHLPCSRFVKKLYCFVMELNQFENGEVFASGGFSTKTFNAMYAIRALQCLIWMYSGNYKIEIKV